MFQGAIGATGHLDIKVNRKQKYDWWSVFKSTFPTNKYKLLNYGSIFKPLMKRGIAEVLHIPTFYGILEATVHKANGEVINYGIVSHKLITTEGVKLVADTMANATDPANLQLMKYHAIGTGTTAAAVADSALGTESKRAVSSSQTSNLASPNANCVSTGTNSITADTAVTEHGLFNVATSGASGEVLFDRSVFTVINLANGDSLTTTYTATFNSGG